MKSKINSRGAANEIHRQDEEIFSCRFILTKIRNGEEALISGLVKDEALVCFSRYNALVREN